MFGGPRLRALDCSQRWWGETPLAAVKDGQETRLPLRLHSGSSSTRPSPLRHAYGVDAAFNTVVLALFVLPLAFTWNQFLPGRDGARCRAHPRPALHPGGGLRAILGLAGRLRPENDVFTGWQELQLGMHHPQTWDPLFQGYMTL